MAGEHFIEEAKQRIKVLTAADPALSDGFSADDLREFEEIVRPLTAWEANQAKNFRIYLEIKPSVRKERLLLIAIIPALAASAARSGKKLLMLVAEDVQAMQWGGAAQRLLGKFDLEIVTWTNGARRLGGFGSQHEKFWFVGDMDTRLPPGERIPLSLGNPMADAILRLTKNRSANYLLLHQVGRQAVQPIV